MYIYFGIHLIIDIQTEFPIILLIIYSTHVFVHLHKQFCLLVCKQVASLQAQLMQMKAQLDQNQTMSRNLENHWSENVGQQFNPFCPTSMNNNPISPQSSLDSIDYSSINDGIMSMQDVQSRENIFSFQSCSKKISYNNNDLGELQELALRMLRNCNQASYKLILICLCFHEGYYSFGVQW